jgi:hypothetical protein
MSAAARLAARAHLLRSSAAGAETLALLAAGVLVQVAVPTRHDWAAHVVGGGALAMLLLVALPARAHRDARSTGAVLVLVAVMAWLLEETVFGPFDVVDVAFTAAGALVVDPSCRDDLVHHNRRTLGAVSVGLLACALAYRYLLTASGV